MSHECENRGETFETLTRLRLHDCSTSMKPGTVQESETEDGIPAQTMDPLMDEIDGGEFGTLHEAIAAYRTMLESALESDGSPDAYRNVLWEYYEPLVNGLDRAVKAKGWPFLQEFVADHHPSTAGEMPLVSPAIENAVGRYVIRTRCTDGVASIPAEALDYLDAVVVETTEKHDVELEESHPYGWGIGHPDHAVADRLHAHASDDVFRVNGPLEHALYADQDAAVEVLERIIRDRSIQHTIPYRTGEIDEARYLLDAIGGADSDDLWPSIPRYWDWHDDLDYSLDWDADVEQRIRNLVAESGVEADLPDEWTFEDLML